LRQDYFTQCQKLVKQQKKWASTHSWQFIIPRSMAAYYFDSMPQVPILAEFESEVEPQVLLDRRMKEPLEVFCQLLRRFIISL
jgi:hypothetical protein